MGYAILNIPPPQKQTAQIVVVSRHLYVCCRGGKNHPTSSTSSPSSDASQECGDTVDASKIRLYNHLGCIKLCKPWVKLSTLLEINISHTKALLKRIFLFPRWDMFFP